MLRSPPRTFASMFVRWVCDFSRVQRSQDDGADRDWRAVRPVWMRSPGCGPWWPGGGAVDHVGLSGFTLKPPPCSFEAGAPHIAGAVGLAVAVDYACGIGFDALRKRMRRLTERSHWRLE